MFGKYGTVLGVNGRIYRQVDVSEYLLSIFSESTLKLKYLIDALVEFCW